MPRTDTLCSTSETETTCIEVDSAENVRHHKFRLDGNGIYSDNHLWKFGGFLGINVSQTALYHWSGGGENNFSFLLSANLYAHYEKKKLIWENNFTANWGMVLNGRLRNVEQSKTNFQKNIDIFNFSTMVGYKANGHLWCSARASFESQFTPTYDYSLTDTSQGRFRKYTVSRFGAPAILNLGPGITWKFKDMLAVFFSPVQGKITFVTQDHPSKDTTTYPDGSLSDYYYDDVDETRFGLQEGRSFMGELGLNLDILFSKVFFKRVKWQSHLSVFAPYLNEGYNTQVYQYFSASDSSGMVSIPANTRFIPVVRWDNDIMFSLTKWLSVSLSAKFIYQYNALVPIDDKLNGTNKKIPDGFTDVDKNGNPVMGYNRLQIFEQFGIGVNARF